MPHSRSVRVVAAVIERDGRILIGQRRASSARHPLKWEFPGGKVEPGEQDRDALRRELVEELAIDAEIGEELARYEFKYPGKSLVELAFYRVTQFQGEPRNLNFERLLWEPLERLGDYDFLEADVSFIACMRECTGDLHRKREGERDPRS